MLKICHNIYIVIASWMFLSFWRVNIHNFIQDTDCVEYTAIGIINVLPCTNIAETIGQLCVIIIETTNTIHLFIRKQ